LKQTIYSDKRVQPTFTDRTHSNASLSLVAVTCDILEPLPLYRHTDWLLQLSLQREIKFICQTNLR